MRRAAADSFQSEYGDPVARFWSKVDQRGDTECWPWTASLYPNGYGVYHATIGGVKVQSAHRASYLIAHGNLPAGRDIDHACHDPNACTAGSACPHRSCVNPWHLEAVTEQVNVLRSGAEAARYATRTHCDNGHELSGANLIMRANGARRCRECKNARARASYRASAASRTPAG